MLVTVGVQEESSVNGPEELNLLHPVCHYPWSTHPADSFSVLSCDRVAEFGLPYNPSTESEDGSHLGGDGNHRGFDLPI